MKNAKKTFICIFYLWRSYLKTKIILLVQNDNWHNFILPPDKFLRWKHPLNHRTCIGWAKKQDLNCGPFCISGVYFAEHSSKSNDYVFRGAAGCPAHMNHSCFECTRTMLLCKVALGRKMLTPRYINCPPTGVDSIVAKPSAFGVSYPEYIVYHQDQVRYIFISPRNVGNWWWKVAFFAELLQLITQNR